jgi:ubiquinone/menaquinone biosynthesis C-methylase UbiE
MHKFSPEKADRLENTDRYEQLKPDQTLGRFGVKEGMTVIDIGAGTGFFSRAASAIVGKNGTVYAIDISFEMLNAFRRFGVPENVHLVQSDEFDIPLPSAISDLTLMAFVLHESENLKKSLTGAARVTKPNGLIAIIDWKKQSEEKGPPVEDRLALNDLLTQVNGYKLVESGDLNPSHYYCILQIQ